MKTTGEKINGSMIIFTIPVRTFSEANRREHWARKAKRVKAQRTAARMLTRANLPNGSVPEAVERCIVTLTRIAPRRLDSDNLAGSMKAVRDGIADALGRDDGSDWYEWRYDQKQGKNYSVQVMRQFIYESPDEVLR
jgi:hypothetical protein